MLVAPNLNTGMHFPGFRVFGAVGSSGVMGTSNLGSVDSLNPPTESDSWAKRRFTSTKKVPLPFNTTRKLKGAISKGMDLESHLMINDWGLASLNTGIVDHDDQRISLNPDDYDGRDVKFYFETDIDNLEATATRTIYLRSGTTTYASRAVPAQTHYFARSRVEFTPAPGNNEYFVRVDQTTAAGDLWCGTAKIVVVQKGATKTRLQIPMANQHHQTQQAPPPSAIATTTSTSYSWPPGYGAMAAVTRFLKDASQYSTIDSWTFEAVLGNSGAYTTYAELRNTTDSADVAASEISRTGTGYALVSTGVATTATNFHDGDEFEVWIKSSSGSGTAQLMNAKLYVNLTNLTKIEEWIRIGRTSYSHTGEEWIHTGRFEVIKNNWTNPTFKLQAMGYCADNNTAFRLKELATDGDPTGGNEENHYQSNINFNSGSEAKNITNPLTLIDDYNYMAYSPATSNNNYARNFFIVVDNTGYGDSNGIRSSVTGNLSMYNPPVPLTGSVTIQSSVPNSTLKVAKKLTSTVAIQSSVPTAPLKATKKLVSSVGIQSNLPNAPLKVTIKITGTVGIQSNVPNAPLKATKKLVSTVGIQSNIPNAPLKATKKVASTVGIQSNVPNSPLSAAKKLVCTVGIQSNVPNSTLTVTRAPTPLSGTVTIQSNVPNSPLSAAKKLVSSVGIQSGTSGVMKGAIKLIGTVGIQSGTVAVLKATKKLSGTTTIQSGSTGTLTNRRPLVSTVTIQSNVPNTTLTIVGIKPLTGTIAIQSSTSGSITRSIGLRSTVTIQSGVTAPLKATKPLTGTSTIQSGTTAALKATKKLLSSVGIQSTVTGTRLGIIAKITGTVGITSTVTGSLQRFKSLASSAAIQSTVTGTLKVGKKLLGSVGITSTTSGTTIASKKLTSTVTETSTVTGQVSRIRPITGAVTITSTVEGEILTYAPFYDTYFATVTLKQPTTIINMLEETTHVEITLKQPTTTILLLNQKPPIKLTGGVQNIVEAIGVLTIL